MDGPPVLGRTPTPTTTLAFCPNYLTHVCSKDTTAGSSGIPKPACGSESKNLTRRLIANARAALAAAKLWRPAASRLPPAPPRPPQERPARSSRCASDCAAGRRCAGWNGHIDTAGEPSAVRLDYVTALGAGGGPNGRDRPTHDHPLGGGWQRNPHVPLQPFRAIERQTAPIFEQADGTRHRGIVFLLPSLCGKIFLRHSLRPRR
jgi:hypothetical protein